MSALFVVIILALAVILAITESKRITNAVDGAASTLHIRMAGLEQSVAEIKASLKERL